jgi:hypothetical protein
LANKLAKPAANIPMKNYKLYTETMLAKQGYLNTTQKSL